MQRRTFLKSSFAVPLLSLQAAPTGPARRSDAEPPEPRLLARGGRPLDAVYVHDVMGPPAEAMTDAVEQFASDICQKYFSDLILYRADTVPINVREQLAYSPEASRGSPAQSERWVRFADGRSRRPRIFLVDSNATDRISEHEFAPNIHEQSITGYSVLVLDDWRTYIDQAAPTTVIDGRSSAAVQRFASSTMSALQLRHCFFRADKRRLSLAFAITKIAPENLENTAVTGAVEDALQRQSDRRVFVHNSDLCVATTAWACEHAMSVWALSTGPSGARTPG